MQVESCLQRTFHPSLPKGISPPSDSLQWDTDPFYRPHSARNTCTPKAGLSLSTRARSLCKISSRSIFSTHFSYYNFSSVFSSNNGDSKAHADYILPDPQFTSLLFIPPCRAARTRSPGRASSNAEQDREVTEQPEAAT